MHDLRPLLTIYLIINYYLGLEKKNPQFMLFVIVQLSDGY